MRVVSWSQRRCSPAIADKKRKWSQPCTFCFVLVYSISVPPHKPPAPPNKKLAREASAGPSFRWFNVPAWRVHARTGLWYNGTRSAGRKQTLYWYVQCRCWFSDFWRSAEWEMLVIGKGFGRSNCVNSLNLLRLFHFFFSSFLHSSLPTLYFHNFTKASLNPFTFLSGIMLFSMEENYTKGK
jgi:hypothetical protein